MTDIFTLGIKADSTDIDRGSKRLDNFADRAAKAEKATKELRKEMNTAAKAVATFGVTAVVALGGIAVSSASAAKEIEKLAFLSGLSAEEFQKAAFAAQAYGIEQDKLSDILKDTQDKVGDFLKTGGGELKDFFDDIAPQIGVTADMFRDLNGKDALQLYVSTLEKANLSQSEMVFFLESIADEATLLQPLLANNGKEFERLADRAEQLGIVLDELDLKNLTEMKTSLTELGAVANATSTIIGATLAPFVVDLTNKFLDNAEAAGSVRETILDIVQVGTIVAGVFANITSVSNIVGKSLAAFVFTVDQVVSGVAGAFGSLFDFVVSEGVDAFSLFALTVGKLTLEMANGLSSGVEAGINAVIGLISDGINSLIETVAPLAELVDIELKKIGKTTISLPKLDTTVFDQAISEIQLGSTELESVMTTTFDNIAFAWNDVNAALLEPLPSEQFNAWFERIQEMILAQRELQNEIKKTGTENRDVVVGSTSDAVKFLSNIKSITQGLGVAFGDNEKAAKALHKVNQVISLTEQAMILQKVIADSAATQTHLANSAAKSSANATEAITSAAAAPFPLGFAAAAAMIGLMASILGGSGGGAVSAPSLSEVTQESQGTGTVFGSDDKSQSILNAQERFEDISIDQLAELRGIRNSISDLSAGIMQLAGGIVSGGIGEFGGGTGTTGALTGSVVSNTILGSFFSSTTKKVVDSGISFVAQSLGTIIDEGIVQAQAFFAVETNKKRFFGLSSSTSTKIETQALDDALNQQIGDIFGSISDTVLQAVQALGIETVTLTKTSFDIIDRTDFGNVFEVITEQFELGIEDAIKEFNVDIGRISLEGLSGEEIQQELQAVFSKQADLLAEFILPGLADFQQIGEGLFDTLIRVTQEQAIFNDSLAVMGVSLAALSSLMQIDIAQSIITLIGGAERFSALTSEFFSEFFTEAEQFEQLSNSLNEAVAGLGLSMFETREQFRQAVEGIDLTTEAGQMLFASLLELVPAMDEFFDSLDSEAAREAAEAERLLSDERRAAEAELNAIRRAEQEALRELAAAEREAEQAANALREAVKAAFSDLAASVRAEQAVIRNRLSDELSNIDAIFDARRASVMARVDRQIDSMVRQLDVANEQVSTLQSLSDTLGGAISQVISLSREQARSLVQGAIEAAGQGQSLTGFDLGGAIGSLSNITPSGFGSALELQLEQARTANQLSKLRDLTVGQLSVAEKSVLLLEGQIEAIDQWGSSQLAQLDRIQLQQEKSAQDRFEGQIAILDSTLMVAQGQLDTLLDVDSSVQSVEDAVAAFNDALLEADRINQASLRDDMERVLKATSAATANAIRPVANLLSETNNLLNAVAINTGNTSKQLERWDIDGIPEERDVS